MRIGSNPERVHNNLNINSYHRVVIPVYIPNLTEPYFKDGLKILKLCIGSLLQTIHQKTRVSLINNGCCDDVSSYLLELYNTHPEIDQLLNSKINLGKINALYSGIKSNLEPLITIADADVMFLNNWQEEVESVFMNFPEAGMVSPVPSSIGYKGNYLNSTIYYAMLKGKLEICDVKDPDGLMKFQESVGRKMYNKAHLEKFLVVSNKNNDKAVLGCGHFMATLRAEVFENAPNEICQHKIVGGSESKYIDAPNDEGGFLRLSTIGNYGYHLGNVYEPWMTQVFKKKSIPNEIKCLDEIPKPIKISKRGYIIGKILHQVLFKKFKSIYFRVRGINENY